MGIIPFPEFWANVTRYNTPGPALLLHFLCTSVFILAAPLQDSKSFMVFSTIPNYARTIISSKSHHSPSLTACSQPANSHPLKSSSA